MHRLPGSVAFAVTCVFAFACGDGGEGGPDGGADAASEDPADAGPDGSVGPVEPAEGLFSVHETHFGEDVFLWTFAGGSIVERRPVYHRLQAEEGACQLWTYEVVDCQPCDGLCSSDGECIPYPQLLSAGPLTVTGLGDNVRLVYDQYAGYQLAGPLPDEFFVGQETVRLTADGGEDVEAFSLRARPAPGIAMDLEVGQEGGARDALRIDDRADLVLTWSPVVPGSRVRLELLSNNASHGLPLDVMILCEADDAGTMTVPRAFLAAMPEKPYQNGCVGLDCPNSSLMRFGSDRARLGDRDIELRVGTDRQFILVHEAR